MNINVDQKQCVQCNAIKTKNDFRKHRRVCKECCNFQSREYYKNNPEKRLEQNKKNKQYKQDNKDKIYPKQSEYKKNNPEIVRECDRRYKAKHKEKLLKKQRQREIERKKTDICYKLRTDVRRTILLCLKKAETTKGGEKSLNYLPFESWLELKQHLELLFEWWMTWDNWGVYRVDSWDDNNPLTWVWNIDHIIPQSDLPYDSMNHPNFKKCWALSNLRPYSAKQNVLDGNRRENYEKNI